MFLSVITVSSVTTLPPAGQPGSSAPEMEMQLAPLLSDLWAGHLWVTCEHQGSEGLPNHLWSLLLLPD